MSASRVQIEARALHAYDCVCAGVPNEDGRVELKATWPDPEGAARRIAAHLNAARGEDVLWVVGLDERRGVILLDQTDIAEWWSQVSRCFDGSPPGLSNFVVQTNEGPVHALFFEASMGPFVVRNPSFGRNGAGPVQLEVPWREGTSVRSAKREDLIRLLVPLQALPDVQTLSASVVLLLRPPDQYGQGLEAGDHLEWIVNLEMYVVPASGSAVVFPVHRTALTFELGGRTIRPTRVSYDAPTAWGARGGVPDSVSVETTASEAIVSMPGRLKVSAHHVEAADRHVEPGQRLLLRFAVTPVHTEHSVRLKVDLPPADEYEDQTRWAIDEEPCEVDEW